MINSNLNVLYRQLYLIMKRFPSEMTSDMTNPLREVLAMDIGLQQRQLVSRIKMDVQYFIAIYTLQLTSV